MKLEVNISKKYFFGILAAIFIIAGIIVGYAYTATPGSVPVPGHALDSIQGYFSGDSNLQVSLGKFCQADGTNCQAGGSSGTSQNGTVMGGGSIVVPPSTTNIQCAHWGGAVCTSNNVVCPTGTTKRLTGKSTAYSQTPESDQLVTGDTTYWYLCINS